VLRSFQVELALRLSYQSQVTDLEKDGLQRRRLRGAAAMRSQVELAFELAFEPGR
jgi:uncharacterized heparinase superfamily protein